MCCTEYCLCTNMIYYYITYFAYTQPMIMHPNNFPKCPKNTWALNQRALQKSSLAENLVTNLIYIFLYSHITDTCVYMSFTKYTCMWCRYTGNCLITNCYGLLAILAQRRKTQLSNHTQFQHSKASKLSTQFSYLCFEKMVYPLLIVLLVNVM